MESPAQPIIPTESATPTTTTGDSVSASAQALTARLVRSLSGLAGLTGFTQAEPVLETKSVEESNKALGEEAAKDNWFLSFIGFWLKPSIYFFNLFYRFKASY